MWGFSICQSGDRTVVIIKPFFHIYICLPMLMCVGNGTEKRSSKTANAMTEECCILISKIVTRAIWNVESFDSSARNGNFANHEAIFSPAAPFSV